MPPISLSARERLLGLFLVFALSAGAFVVVVRRVRQEPERGMIQAQATVPRRVAKPEYRRLVIPRIGVDAAVDPVGRTANGDMDVPKRADEVGWYKFGPALGGTGSAVLDGHLDTKSGKPAVFWRLRELRVGDDVYVADQIGTRHRYRVEKTASYAYADIPLARLFGRSDGIYLNLITCAGSWSRAAGTYDKRVVIYTRLVLDGSPK
jgi:sortase (surface protein transpeptidase)